MRWLIAVLLTVLLTVGAQAQTVQPWVSGAASATGTAATQIIAAPSTGAAMPTALFITGVQCGRTDAGTTATFVTFNDTNATILVLPNSGGGGGNNAVFNSPISPGPSTKFTFTSSGSISTVYCNAQGFIR